MVQSLVRTKSRLRVKGLKVKDREKIKEAIAISIQNGHHTTRDIGIDIGKITARYRGILPKWKEKVLRAYPKSPLAL